MIEQYLDEFFKDLKHTPGPWEKCSTQHNQGETMCIQTKKGKVISEVLVHFESELEAKSNTVLLSQAPETLRTLCRTYLTLLVKFAYGKTTVATTARILMNPELADLRNAISLSTGMGGKEVQDTFEHFVYRINANR